MLFNSQEFAIFFPTVTAGYFLLPHRMRWIWLLLASSVFYMYFIPKYILILAFTIGVDYCAGIFIERSEARARLLWLWASLVANVGVLATFKYFDFFSKSLERIAVAIGWNYSFPVLGWILPIGLSFHTFQAMSYTIEVYHRRYPAERHLGIYALYVMFYPQLVAGPIERPGHLLPQFRQPQRFEYERVCDGLGLMAWGFFKKLVVADRLALFVNPVYSDPHWFSGPALTLATIAFAFQIYGDFSGYSDIAIGAARVMGIDLARNFRTPYLAVSLADFWHRWHISLSTWFRDYVYIPLGGSRVSERRHVFNLIVVFTLSGLWHGANWTFVIWGLIHGLALAATVLLPWRAWDIPLSSRLRVIFGTFLTFAIVDVGWVFFRAVSLTDALFVLGHLATGWRGGLRLPTIADPLSLPTIVSLTLSGLAVLVMMVAEHWYPNAGLRGFVRTRAWWIRWPAYYALASAVLMFGVFDRSAFIYFQF